MLMDRGSVPPYDERLRGYFENKVVHSRHIAALGCASNAPNQQRQQQRL